MMSGPHPLPYNTVQIVHVHHYFPDLNVLTVVGGVSMIGSILALSVAVGCMISRIRISRLESRNT